MLSSAIKTFLVSASPIETVRVQHSAHIAAIVFKFLSAAQHYASDSRHRPMLYVSKRHENLVDFCVAYRYLSGAILSHIAGIVFKFFSATQQ